MRKQRLAYGHTANWVTRSCDSSWSCLTLYSAFSILYHIAFPHPDLTLFNSYTPLRISTRRFSNSVVRDGPRSRSWQRPWSQGTDVWGRDHRPKTINKYMGSIYQFGRKAKKENEAVERRTRLTRGALFSIGQSEKAPPWGGNIWAEIAYDEVQDGVKKLSPGPGEGGVSMEWQWRPHPLTSILLGWNRSICWPPDLIKFFWVSVPASLKWG